MRVPEVFFVIILVIACVFLLMDRKLPVPSKAVICLILGYLRWDYVLEVTEVASTLFNAVCQYLYW